MLITDVEFVPDHPAVSTKSHMREEPHVSLWVEADEGEHHYLLGPLYDRAGRLQYAIRQDRLLIRGSKDGPQTLPKASELFQFLEALNRLATGVLREMEQGAGALIGAKFDVETVHSRIHPERYIPVPTKIHRWKPYDPDWVNDLDIGGVDGERMRKTA